MEALEPDDPRSVETEGRHYRVLARIGSGGMGVVYLGRSAGGRTVAIKMVHADFAEDHEFRIRFRREVDVARSVGGAFTAPVIDADPSARIPWSVSEFLPSVSVREAVTHWGALPDDAVWELAAGIAEALVSIHHAGVVHRDLKPANVLLTADGPRVIDFGIARAVDAATVTRPGSHAGSPGFMSPEQAAGAPVGPPGDIFSLGSTLVYASTGEEPFGPGPWHEKMRRIQSEAPRLDGIGDDALRAVIAWCMDRDPSRRPTAARLTDHLASMDRIHERDGGPRLPAPVAAEIVNRRNEADNPPVAPVPATVPVWSGPGRRARHVAVIVAVLVVAGVGLPVAIRYGADGSRADPATTPTPSRPAATVVRTPQSPRHELEFSVTGNVRVTTLTYTVNNQSTTLKNLKLPWRKTVELPTWVPRSSWKFVYRAPPGTVHYTVSIDKSPVSTGESSSTGPTGINGHADGVY